MEGTRETGRAGRQARRVALVAVVSVVAAVVYLLLRVPAASELHSSFVDSCQRAHMQPGDWPCRVGPGDALLHYLAASLLLGLGLGAAALMVALTGRRVAWLVPLLAPLAVKLATGGWAWFWTRSGGEPWHPLLGMLSLGGSPGESFWFRHQLAAAVLDLALLSLPALAVVLVLRPEAPTRPRPPVWALRTAFLVCAGGAVLVIRLAFGPNLLGAFLEETLAIGGSLEDWLAPVLVVGLAGVLVGPDRRWLAWTLVPVAVLVSGAPSLAALASIWRLWLLSPFGAVVPLVAVGLLGSAVQPLAARLAAFRGRRSPGGVPGPRRLDPRPRFRRAALGAGLSAGLLAMTVVMRVADPSEVQISIALPSYLGARVSVQDLRARMNLDRARTVLATYREEEGTLKGLDAATAEALDPALEWADGVPRNPSDEGVPLGVWVLTAGADGAELLVVSPSGNAFCLRERAGPDGPVVTYGSGTEGGYSTGAFRATVETAIASCGERAWDESGLRPPPIDALCAESPDEALTICRAVQALLRRTLASPVGEGA